MWAYNISLWIIRQQAYQIHKLMRMVVKHLNRSARFDGILHKKHLQWDNTGLAYENKNTLHSQLGFSVLCFYTTENRIYMFSNHYNHSVLDLKHQK